MHNSGINRYRRPLGKALTFFTFNTAIVFASLAQNKIVFSDKKVVPRHEIPADSPLGRVDHSLKPTLERIEEYGINSVSNEHGPLVEPGGERLFFSRSNHEGNVGGLNDAEDIWVATWDRSSHSWAKVERLPAPLNTAGPNFVTSISVENGVETLILGNEYENGEVSGEGLSFSELHDGKWTDPVNFLIRGFENKSKKVDFFVSEDGKYLLISAKMDDSKGGRDIYISQRVDKHTWEKPVNLKGLNTAGDETAPSFSPDGRFMFFSSDGFDGYGGLDIYYSERLDDTWLNWSPPADLGVQFNDEHDNVHFSLPPAGEKIFFVSENKQGNTDIFSFATSTEELYAELTGEPVCFAEKVFVSESTFAHRLECNICVELEYQTDNPRGDVKYIWDFGDSYSEQGQKVSHCYDVHGNYDIRLSVVDAATNEVISSTDHFYELNEHLELKMDAAGDGSINEEIKFSSHLAGGYPANVEFYWDFGDGYFACGDMATHTYVLPKTYTVRTLAVFEWLGGVRYLETEQSIIITTEKSVSARLEK